MTQLLSLITTQKFPPQDVTVNNVEVTWDGNKTNPSLTVEIDPLTCPQGEQDDFHLFGIKDADIVGLDLSNVGDESAKQAAIQAHLKTSDNATFTHPAWGGGTVTVERLLRGSRDRNL